MFSELKQFSSRSTVKIMSQPLPIHHKLNLLISLKSLTGVILLIGGFLLVFTIDYSKLMAQWRFSWGEYSIAEGQITGILEDKEGYIYGYNFVHYVDSIGSINNISYGYKADLSLGNTVTVLHLPENPQVSKIGGLRITEDTWLHLFLYILPCLGLYLVISSVINWQSKLKLLHHGVFTVGRMARKAIVSKKDGSTSYELHFEFRDFNHTLQEGYITVDDPKDFKVGKSIPILYKREDPQSIVIVSWLPAKTAAYITKHWRPH